MIVICIIRDEEDDNNYAYEAETYLPSPAVDETNVG